ncbi:YbaN family protein [Psychrobium sp. 1_MG-2023]|uniref:YbaN family protein n=1 Tax=Psychrobium sp. 1_MG-2023 TaxID=3062624 RepID=UPI0027325B2D|nr:YbaN family protein [Psychrobium sp. 1_MG-2023]MDP2561848.1 YbaN family protein [Psychrobium sp. 1_MG-2023]
MSTLSKFKKYSLITIGVTSVALGVIGIILPLLPTTPFLLLSAACFAKSSDRFYQWLITHPWFGEYIENYRSGRGIPMKVKISTIFLLWLSIGSSVIFFVSFFWAKVMLIIIATCVSYYLLSRPTLDKKTATK